MPASKRLEAYPEFLFDIAEYFRNGGQTFRKAMPSHGAAVNTRQRFYSFRNLLIAENAAMWASSINAIQIRIENDSVLVFENVDNTEIALAIKAELAKLKAEQGQAEHPLRRSTDHADSTDESPAPVNPAPSSTVGQMGDQGTNAILNRYGFEE